MKKEVSKIESGVKILFKGEIKKKNIVKMVENCSNGQCECMSSETKAKIKDIKVNGEDGNVELKLEGDIEVDEIKEALSKSKILKS